MQKIKQLKKNEILALTLGLLLMSVLFVLIALTDQKISGNYYLLIPIIGSIIFIYIFIRTIRNRIRKQ